MKIYRVFKRYKPGVGYTDVDILSGSATVYDTTDSSVVEEDVELIKHPYRPVGLYYAELADTNYQPGRLYRVVWTFVIVEGHSQTNESFFEPSALISIDFTGGPVAVLEDSGYCAYLISED